MLNKFYKIINNKYSSFLKFVFFLRYLFLIFFISLAFFLIIPNFFNYEKKKQIISDYLSINYGFELKKNDKIKFNSFPLPNLEINNLEFNLFLKDNNLTTKKLIIYPKFISIYNYDNFRIKKIKLIDSDMVTNFQNIKNLTSRIFQLQNKIYFDDLDIKIKNFEDTIILLKNIDFSNYGYKKNLVQGEIFNQNFKIKVHKNFKKINFKLNNTGISSELILSDNNFPSSIGDLKVKLLNSNLKINFNYHNNEFKINRAFFRSKNLSFDSDGFILFKPFFKIDLNSKINNFNFNLLNKINIDEILRRKIFIKKINSHNLFLYSPKKFQRSLIDNLKIEINLAYGRMLLSKKFSISNSEFKCTNKINLIDEYPVLYFDCSVYSQDKKKLLKKFKINIKNKKDVLGLTVIGNLNILNNKINFDSIKTIDNYQASKEDLKYFKNTFENILFDENFLKIFNMSKIRNFILEVS